MTVTHIGEARRRREERAERITRATDWVLCEIPWTSSFRFHPDFSRKCAGMDRADLSALDTELTRWAEHVEHHADIRLLAQSLPGRADRCRAAAAWLFENQSLGMHDEEFHRRFGDLTRAELVRVLAEHMRLSNSMTR